MPGFTVESPSFTTAKVSVRLSVRFFKKTGWLTVIAAHSFACRWIALRSLAAAGSRVTSTATTTNANRSIHLLDAAFVENADSPLKGVAILHQRPYAVFERHEVAAAQFSWAVAAGLILCWFSVKWRQCVLR
jgi:hypothetical protein